MRFRRASLAVVALVLSASSFSWAQTPPAEDQMKKDIEALKEGQKAIQKDLE